MDHCGRQSGTSKLSSHSLWFPFQVRGKASSGRGVQSVPGTGQKEDRPFPGATLRLQPGKVIQGVAKGKAHINMHNNNNQYYEGLSPYTEQEMQS